MEQIRYTVILDITDNGCFNTGWRLKQGDGQNIVLDVKVTNNGENYVAENPPRIVFKRPDGYSVIGQMDASGEDFYTYTIVGNEIAVAGNVLMDVKFGEDEDRTSTASCKFEVIPDTIGQSSGGSGIYDNTLAELVEESRINVLLAESYTKGGTGIRSGEETDNARYYKDKAAETVDTVMREYLIENVDYLKNQNRFNPSKVTNGKINIENGNIISDSNYITSDYIPFDLTKVNNSRVKFGASSYGGDDLIVQLYDNQKRNIRTLFYGSLGISWIGTNFMEEVSIPENDVLRYDLVYVRYSLQKDSINPILGNRALFDYSTFGDYKSNKVLSEDLTQFSNDGFLPKNLNKYSLILGTRSTTGKIGIDNSTSCLSGVIELEPNTEYTLTIDGVTSIPNFRYYTYISKDESTLSVTQNLGTVTLPYTFTTSANEHGFSFQSGSNTNLVGKNVQVEKGSQATPYQPYAPSNIELMENLTQLSIATTKAITTNVTSAYGSIGYASFTQIGNTKKIYAEINVTSQLSAWGVVCTLPTEARPSATQTLSISVGANRYRGFLNTDGTITTSSPITSGQTVVLESIYI